MLSVIMLNVVLLNVAHDAFMMRVIMKNAIVHVYMHT